MALFSIAHLLPWQSRGRLGGIALSIAALASLATCGAASDGPPVPVGKQTYVLTFTQDVAAGRFAKAFPGLATWSYFGAEPDLRRRGLPLTPALQATSRTWPGIDTMYVDPQYCPGAQTPAIHGGALALTAYRFNVADFARCGQGKRHWGSSYVSSLPSFAQTYGYWEIEAKLPCDSGRWPAFWLLPVAKTPQNGGRLAEVDVFEHYGGTLTVQSQGKPFVINRIGTPFSTLHYGVNGNEQKASNANALPQLSDAERSAFCSNWHRFGVSWTKQQFRFFIDGHETFKTPNPEVDDPHYWVLNLDISPHAGNPDAAPNPSTYRVRSVRVWTMP